MEFEQENDMMEQRQEMMDDAIDDAMDAWRGGGGASEDRLSRSLRRLASISNQAVSGAPAFFLSVPVLLAPTIRTSTDHIL